MDKAHSPLDTFTGNAILQMEELTGIGKVIFRSEPDDKTQAAFKKATGSELPLKANTSSAAEDCTVFWMGPNEWMIHCPENEATSLAERLRKENDGSHVAVIDVSDYYTVIRIGGSHAEAALAHGCPVDTHPMKAGDCAQSRFDTAAILFHKVSDSPVFDIQVRRSFAEHVGNLLNLVAEEFGEE